MFDAFATAVAMALERCDHRRRRDLLMFSALPDAPVMPDTPSRWSRLARLLRRRRRGSPARATAALAGHHHRASDEEAEVLAACCHAA